MNNQEDLFPIHFDKMPRDTQIATRSKTSASMVTTCSTIFSQVGSEFNSLTVLE